MIYFSASPLSDVALKVTERLKLFLPESLPVLGTIVQNSLYRDSESSAMSSHLYLWTSFNPHAKSKPDDIFSVITFAANDNSARFFCSADHQRDTSQDEHEHVSSFIRAFLLHLSQKESRSIPITISSTTGEPTSEVVLGSLHDKWLRCVQDLVNRVAPHVKYLRRPQGVHSPNDLDRLPNFIVSQILPSDIPSVISASRPRRSPAYILSRLSQSACIRLPPASSCDNGEPVAWVLLHADGSIGNLHVQSEYRRWGLAKAVTKELVYKVGGGAEGWNWFVFSRVTWNRKVLWSLYVTGSGVGRVIVYCLSILVRKYVAYELRRYYY